MSSAATELRRQAAAPSVDGTRATEIKLIHIGRGVLKLDEEAYRGLINGVSGGRTGSSAELTDSERQAVLKRMRSLGFVPKPRKASGAAGVALIREAQLRKLRAMWYALAEVDGVNRPHSPAACNEAIACWAASRLPHLTGAQPLTVDPLAALRAADGADMAELIEQMKAWGDRVGANVHQATLPAAA